MKLKRRILKKGTGSELKDDGQGWRIENRLKEDKKRGNVL